MESQLGTKRATRASKYQSVSINDCLQSSHCSYYDRDTDREERPSARALRLQQQWMMCVSTHESHICHIIKFAMHDDTHIWTVDSCSLNKAERVACSFTIAVRICYIVIIVQRNFDGDCHTRTFMDTSRLMPVVTRCESCASIPPLPGRRSPPLDAVATAQVSKTSTHMADDNAPPWPCAVVGCFVTTGVSVVCARAHPDTSTRHDVVVRDSLDVARGAAATRQ